MQHPPIQGVFSGNHFHDISRVAAQTGPRTKHINPPALGRWNKQSTTMKKLILKTTLLLATMLAVPMSAHAIAIVYSVNQTIGSGSVLGTITTNGTIGALVASDVTAFSLDISSPSVSGGVPQRLTQVSDSLFLVGPSLVASAGALTWNFAPEDGSTFKFTKNFSGLAWCGANSGEVYTYCEGRTVDVFTIQGDFDLFESAAQSGTVTIATAIAPIPEPETYALMLAGLAVVGAAARRRKAK
jgi:hypothetical protein